MAKFKAAWPDATLIVQDAPLVEPFKQLKFEQLSCGSNMASLAEPEPAVLVFVNAR